MFDFPVDKSIPQIEEDVLAFWKENKIFEKSVDQRPQDNLYVFYDGPPFISGLPHYGHLLGSIAKDVIPRYWTMKGKRVERVWGWDAHGLTVENRVQKKLGIKERRGIESFGLKKFAKECYKYTLEISAEWEWYIDKIGRWVDMKNAYKTIDKDYMESVIWVFKELYDKGLIYEGVRTSLYCPTCGTPVSDFEVSIDNSYKDVEDPAVTVKFKILTSGDFKDMYLLAWTTTPWTLPSNKALVVDENETYVVVGLDGSEYIVAEKRFEDIFGPSNEAPAPKGSFLGSELLGLEYAPLYDIYAPNNLDFKIYSYEDMVNMEEGTGIVHSAPGFGDIDTQMGQHYGLSITMAIDDEGRFRAGDAKKNPYEGLYFKEADEPIMHDLEAQKLLFKKTTLVHRYPYHDRCDTLLIHRAQNSWFLDVNALKEGMLKGNESINWVPSNIKYGQFKTVIENAPDWCISRNRFWATPMPVWESEDSERIVVGSIKELEELSGQKVKDLHRPFIDEIEIKKGKKVYRRCPEVLDSWFEAASMPYAQIHYPFENQEKFEKNFPGDYVVEYIAQVRAWFNVMHRISTGLFGTHPFRHVIATGVMAGSDGRKMSKTYQNYVDPKDVLEAIGGDALRLYLMNSPLMVGGNMDFDDMELRTKSRNVLNPLWNSLKFFLLYAKEYKWEPVGEDIPKVSHVLDKWILARLQETIENIATNLEAYLVPGAVQPVEDFVDDLSRWYVRRSRERISSKDEEALATLYYVLLTFAKASAPIIPFMAESIYQSLKTKKMLESVHLCSYPKAMPPSVEVTALIAAMANTRQVVSAALSERPYSIRQPLSGLTLHLTKEKFDFFEDLVKEEVNVDIIDTTVGKSGNIVFSVEWDKELTEDLEVRGQMRELVRKIQGLRKKEGFSIKDKIEVIYEDTSQNRKVVDQFGDKIKEKVAAVRLTPGDRYAIEKA